MFEQFRYIAQCMPVQNRHTRWAAWRLLVEDGEAPPPALDPRTGRATTRCGVAVAATHFSRSLPSEISLHRSREYQTAVQADALSLHSRSIGNLLCRVILGADG